MLKSSLWDYLDAHTLVSGTAALAEIAAYGRNNDIEAYLKMWSVQSLHQRNN